MPVMQLSLWDNVAMENGFRFLADMHFEKALPHLHEALDEPGDKKIIQKALEACHYWQPMLLPEACDTKQLLQSFTSYPFIPQLTGFKNTLIAFIADLISEKQNMAIQDVVIAFDLLINCDNFQKAENLISAAIKQYPEKHDLLYFLAQAQWKDGHTLKANHHYVRALLYHPDKTMISRIENSRLREIAQTHEPFNIPAYAWIQGILPFVPMADDIKYWNEDHQKAVQAYHLLKQSEKSLQNNDLKASIRFRKELKQTDPDLYQAYFKRLK